MNHAMTESEGSPPGLAKRRMLANSRMMPLSWSLEGDLRLHSVVDHIEVLVLAKSDCLYFGLAAEQRGIRVC